MPRNEGRKQEGYCWQHTHPHYRHDPEGYEGKSGGVPIHMNLEGYKSPSVKKSGARNSREALIEDIVAATTERRKRLLARALAVAANTLKWSDQQLHVLYQKRLDPKVRNYTALVWWHVKVTHKDGGAKQVPETREVA